MAGFAANMAKNYAQQQFGDVVGKSNSFFSFDLLKDYFDVTNAYVLSKFRLILFPFSPPAEEWKRLTPGMDYSSQTEDYLTPKNDV